MVRMTIVHDDGESGQPIEFDKHESYQFALQESQKVVPDKGVRFAVITNFNKQKIIERNK